MSKFWSDLTRGLTPYEPGEQPKVADIIKLNTNENPFGPSPKALKAMASAVSNSLRLYPDPNCTELKKALAHANGLSTDQVFVGNGSDEVLAHTFQALLKQDAAILFPDITYGFYPVYAKLFGIEHQTIPLDENLAINPDDYLVANGGIIIANPNAPTGLLLKLESIQRLLEGNPDRVVVIDEAYIDFGGESAVKLIDQYDNLLVVQTFSKSRSLAGLRVGMAFGQSHLIGGLERLKNSFNPYPLSRETLAGAAASVSDVSYFELTCRKIIAQRNEMSQALAKMGFVLTDSQANFVFATHPQHDASYLAEQLRERNIIVRHLTASPRTENHLRISIGSSGDCQVLIAALADII